MDLTLSAEGESFRQELRTWLREHLLKYKPLLGRTNQLDGPKDAGELALAKQWQRELLAAGYLAPSWPREFGGQAMEPMREVILREELVRAGAPHPPGTAGIEMLGPTLIKWGTDAQKRRFLPKILTAEEIWCQGFSEPGAGSDLASLRTRAVIDGDNFVVNGQKVWTSGAHLSDMMFVLVRTEPAAPKHQGISFLLLDMHAPGVSVRPLVQITGNREFNEVFFDNVRVPRENLVGELNQGWRIAIDTLLNERFMIAAGMGTEMMFQRLLSLGRSIQHDGMPLTADPAWRQRLAKLEARVTATHFHHLRQVSDRAAGRREGAEVFINKLVATELQHDIAAAAMEMMGEYAPLEKGEEFALDGGVWPGEWMLTLGACIGGGSTQIQKNTIAERALGMPKSR